MIGVSVEEFLDGDFELIGCMISFLLSSLVMIALDAGTESWVVFLLFFFLVINCSLDRFIGSAEGEAPDFDTSYLDATFALEVSDGLFGADFIEDDIVDIETGLC